MSALNTTGGIQPTQARRWWVVAAGLLGIALCGVLAWTAVKESAVVKFGNTPALTFNGSAFQVTRGVGHAQNEFLILDAAVDGVAAISAEVAPFQADKYARVEWTLHTADPPDAIAFVWRTRENPRRSYSKPLSWLAGRIAPLRLDPSDGWRGTITGVALVVRGTLTAPLRVDTVHLPSGTVGGTLIESLAQWATYYPLAGYAVAYPFDVERRHLLPVAKALALAVAAAIVAYLVIVRLLERPLDVRVCWAIFAAAWILLDVRWQVNLVREVTASVGRFWGKSGDERLMAAEDSALLVVAQDIRRGLPPPPVRLIVLCDNGLIAIRLARFLYPHNVWHSNISQAALQAGGYVPERTSLRSGDYLALVWYSALGYDSVRRALVWPDGTQREAELVLAKPDMLLVRIK
jgi:hypothetical protein